MAADNDPVLLTAGAMAKSFNVSPAKVKKAIADASLEPANIRCGCKYYSQKDAYKVEKIVKG